MQQRYTTILLFLLFTAVSALLFAQTFIASVPVNIIGTNETTELKLVIVNATKSVNITPPLLKNFIVLSGPNEESGDITINGATLNYVGFSYILKPRSKGVFTIPATTANADGKILRSNPVRIKVINEAASNVQLQTRSPSAGLEPQPTNYNDFILKQGDDVQDKISKNLFIKVYTDKTSCYVNEPIVVTYKLYTRLKSESNIAKNPAFNGFSVIDLMPPQSGVSYTVEKLDGRDYNVYVLRKAQLYPLQAGDVVLDPAVIDNNIHFIKDEYLQQAQTDESGDFIPGTVPAEGRHDERVTIESKPVIISVRPLPEKGKPASFHGATGNFIMDAFIEKDSLTTDDAGKLKLLLSGQGNMTLLPAPEINWPKDLEGYEPRVKDGLNKLSVPVSGSKIFDYAFTAAKAGDYTIAPVVFSYFDVDSGKYKTISTKPITVHVDKGTGKRPVIAGEKMNKPESFAEKIFTHRWMIVLPVSLLIIIGLLLWVRADKKRQKEKLITAALQQPAEEEKVENIFPSTPLEQSERMLIQNETRKFYETIDRELHIFLAHKLKLPPEAVSKKNIADALDKSGVSLTDSLAIQKLLDEIALQLYTPFADESKMQEYYVAAVQLVNKISMA